MKKLFIIASLLLCWHNLSAQQLDYPSYLERVLSNNLDYQIAQLDLSVAQSELKSARKFNDMSLSAEYGNNSDWDIAMGQSLSLELSKSISLGKRNARIDVAKNALLAAESTLEAFRMTLKAEATEAYLHALLNRDLMLIIKHSADQMIELYRSDSLRAARGEISELDALQSRLEATMALQEQRRAEAEYHNANIQLAQLMGVPTLQIDQLQGTLSKPTKLYSISALTDSALARRQDLIAAQHQSNAAQCELTSIRRERSPDIDIALGANYNTQVRNEEAPAPQFVGYTAGISIPLPISNLNRGEVKAGQMRVQQAQIQADLQRQQVQVEILQAYNTYEAALMRANDFDSYLMDNAQQVLNGRLYAYQRGETTLLEVLNAQHTYNDILQAYATALYESMAAWVELNRAAAVWDFEL